LKTSDLLTLVEYNRWANQRLLRQVKKLSPEQLAAPCWLSQGNVMETSIHILDASWYWRLACQEGTAPAERLSAERYPSLDALWGSWTEEDARLVDYVGSLSDAAVEGQIEFTPPRARPRRMILWHIIVHIVNHGSHHRAEVGLYLNTLGKSPRDMDFILYMAKYAHKA